MTGGYWNAPPDRPVAIFPTIQDTTGLGLRGWLGGVFHYPSKRPTLNPFCLVVERENSIPFTLFLLMAYGVRSIYSADPPYCVCGNPDQPSRSFLLFVFWSVLHFPSKQGSLDHGVKGGRLRLWLRRLQ